MKKVVLLLALCMLLPLGGCAAMLERSHVSSTAHADYAVVVEDSSLRVETYQGLVNSLLYFIREHSEGGSIRLYNYTGDVEADLEAARAEVLEQDPIGSYAVQTLECSSTRILTYCEVTVAISYAHTAEELEAIRPLSSVAALRQEVERMTEEREGEAVFLVSYFSGDEELVRDMLWQSVCDAPELYAFPAGIGGHHDIVLYPETGTRRIVEIRVDWHTDREEARRQAKETADAAAVFLAAHPPAGEAYVPTELAESLRAAVGGWRRQGTSIPLGVLTGEPASKLGLLLTTEYLCHHCGIEAMAVSGTAPQPDVDGWLIVSTPEGWRHLTMEPFYPWTEEDGAGEDAEQEPFRLYTDDELLALGYEWNAALYPACVGEAPGAAEETDGPEAGRAPVQTQKFSAPY